MDLKRVAVLTYLRRLALELIGMVIEKDGHGEQGRATAKVL